MANKNQAKIQFTADCKEFNEQIGKANSTMTELRSELKLNATQMDANGKSIDKLEEKHSILQRQLEASKDKTEALSGKLDAAIRNYGQGSAEVDKYRTQLNNAKTAQIKLEQAVNDCEKEIEEFNAEVKDSKKATKEASEGFTVFKGVVADLAADAIQAAIGKLSEFASYLAELPAETMELRQSMSTLTTAFDTQKFSTETATEIWKDLYAVFGDDQTAVEAANHIARMSDNQQDLNDWVRISTGLYATYQDAINPASIAESAKETAACGKVTGQFADALNWSSEAATMFAGYMSEDVTTAEDAFNVALSECTTEQERQALITDTLTKLYGGAADTYRETAGAQLEAKEVAAEHMLVENDLASSIEPVTTAWQEMKTTLLTSLKPAIDTITETMLGVLEWMKEHPTAVKAIAAAVAVLAIGLGGLAIAVGIYTAAQWAMNAAVLANPITWIVVGIIAAIAALVAIGVVLYENWDVIKAKCAELWANVKQAFSNMKEAVVTKVTELKNGAVAKFNEVKSSVSNIFSNIKSTISNALSNAVSTVTSKLNSIKEKFSSIMNSAKSIVSNAIAKIKGFFNFSWSLPKLKMPHFSISGKFSLNPPSIPKISVDWYKDGGIFTKPTIFDTAYGLKGVGEAGAEAVLPIDRLEGYISGAIEKAQNVVNLNALANAIGDLANRPIVMNVNGRQFATATASDSDSVNGLRTSFKSRGLIVE